MNLTDLAHCPGCGNHMPRGQSKCRQCSIDDLLDRINAVGKEEEEESNAGSKHWWN